MLPDLDSVWSMPEQQLESPVEAAEEDPLITPTMAELYVSQGFPDKAIAIYRKIVDADALNQDAVARLAELEHSADAADAAQSAVAAAEQAPAQISLPVEGAADQQAKISVLEGWLENIRRLRVCR
jgi:lipopolysaccharide biosynthesis regulator YciM